MGELGTVLTGTTPPTSDRECYGGKYLFVSPADIQENRDVVTTQTRLSEKGYNLGRKLKPGSTLVVCIGSTIGKVAQLKGAGTTNQQINAIESSSLNEDNFVCALMMGMTRSIREMSSNQAVPILNKETFSSIEIHAPILSEQKAVGSFFQQLDSLITLHQRKPVPKNER